MNQIDKDWDIFIDVLTGSILTLALIALALTVIAQIVIWRG